MMSLCMICGRTYEDNHVCDKLSYSPAKTISELRVKTSNLLALSQGISSDFKVLPHPEKAERLLFSLCAHLAQAQDAADVLQWLYPMETKK